MARTGDPIGVTHANEEFSKALADLKQAYFDAGVGKGQIIAPVLDGGGNTISVKKLLTLIDKSEYIYIRSRGEIETALIAGLAGEIGKYELKGKPSETYTALGISPRLGTIMIDVVG